MQVVKDNKISEDNWQFVADDTGLSGSNNIISVVRLQRNDAEVVNYKGKLGVRLAPADSVDGIVNHLAKIDLVELHFPDLADGRLFSLAWLLRNRYKYKGEIRATGNYLPEQVFYLSRVGVNSFMPMKTEDLQVTLTNLKDFSVKYQPSVN